MCKSGMEFRETDMPFRVGVFPVPGFALMSYACTVEPLRAANLLAKQALYEVVNFGGPKTQSSGAVDVPADYPVGSVPPLDLMLVIAGGDPAAFRDGATYRWLRRLDRAGVQLGGVSGGPVILAQAGLMAERRMTVHWEHGPALADQHPDLLIERRLYVIDRDRVTCGGGTAPLDLMHALITSHHGHDLARRVSDWFLHTDIRASAAPQRAGLVERLGTRSSRVLDAVAAMEDHIADPLTLPQLALIAGVTERQLNRLFRTELGASTMSYYRGVRLDVAQGLLEGSALPIGEIASATGFASAPHFSQAYVRAFGHPPSSVRRT